MQDREPVTTYISFEAALEAVENIVKKSSKGDFCQRHVSVLYKLMQKICVQEGLKFPREPDSIGPGIYYVGPTNEDRLNNNKKELED